jgi:MerR family transcriptional regulator, light-induced transcriptional regulator
LSESKPAHDARGPLLPIGAVVADVRRIYPDVTHSSLRFLEREGLITATRTPGGHRLYTPDHIERILQIKAWQGQRLSLAQIRRRLAQLDSLPAPAALAATFLQQAREGDLAAAYQTIVATDTVGMPLTRLFGEVLQPALIEVGQRWEHGDLLVAQEKEISELARDLITELSRRHMRTMPQAPPLVAACVEGEYHELGLRMICGLLRASGHAIHYLGADVAPRFLLEAARLHQPVAVLLSAKLDRNLPAIRDAIDVLTGGVPPGRLPHVAVGGRVAIGHSATLRAWGAIPIASDRLDANVDAVSALLSPAAEESTVAPGARG